MTVRTPTEDEQRRAELIQQGIWPGPPATSQVGGKGIEEAKRRFGKRK